MIDLRSDTVTKPGAAMRAAMAEAEVGDDVYGEDPAVNRLQQRAAEMLGKEAALLVPSGTMGNLVSLLSLTRPGDTVIMSDGAHPYHYEGANVALVGGLLTRLVPGAQGIMEPEAIAAAIVQTDDSHFSHTTAVAIENTTNRGGGAYYTVEQVEAIGALCRDRGLRLHMDGARLFNAVVASGRTAAEYAAPCDTLSFCLSKGLGCPAGSLVAGPRETIHRAHRFRKLLGGGMRQAGVLAAAGLYAIEHHIESLAEDHRRAREFRAALEARGLRFPYPSPTNIVYLEAEDAFAAVGALGGRGVLALPVGPKLMRAVFHRDVDDAGLAQAIDAFAAALA